MLVRDVYDTAVEAGYDAASERLLPLLANFVSDTEPAVRQVFAEQLFPLATFFLEVWMIFFFNFLQNIVVVVVIFHDLIRWPLCHPAKKRGGTKRNRESHLNCAIIIIIMPLLQLL